MKVDAGITANGRYFTKLRISDFNKWAKENYKCSRRAILAEFCNAIYKECASNEFRSSLEEAKKVAHDCGVYLAFLWHDFLYLYKFADTYEEVCIPVFRFCPPISKETWTMEVNNACMGFMIGELEKNIAQYGMTLEDIRQWM